MFKFYLNNTLVSDPINWNEFTETIERDELIKGLLPKYDQKLTFTDEGYVLLRNLLTTNGFCNLVDLRVEYKCGGAVGYEIILDGYIFLSDCKFNLNKCFVDCSVEDNNFGSRIYNNKSIELYLDSTLSKNLETITPCITKDVTFFVPSTGADVVGLRKVYPIWSAFKYLIDFISDGLIDFESTFITQKNLALTTGALLRNISGSASPKISFDTLFKEVNKKYPLVFTIIKQSNGRPLIKIENEDYFFGNASGLVIQNVQDLQQSINSEMLYSEIAIGGTTVKYDALIHSVPGDLRMMFAQENYYFQSECNIDKKLDLAGVFICDSNIIEELVATNTTNNAYDESVFFVQVTYSSGILGNTAVKTSLLTTSVTPYYYNNALTSAMVAQNLNIYADLIQYINANDIGFMATKNATYTFPYHRLADYTYNFAGIINPLSSTTELITYQNDSTPPNHDTGNNYTANSRYTAPVDGHYYFQSSLNIEVHTDIPFPLPKANIMIQFYLYIRKYSAANILIDTHTVSVGLTDLYGYKVFIWPGAFNMSGEKMFFLEAGDYVETYFKWVSVPHKSYSPSGIYNGEPTSANVNIMGESLTYFKTLTTEGNGMLVTGSSLDYNVEKLEFERPISNTDYNTLKADLSKSLTINHDGVENRVGWIRKSVRNFTTSNTKIELISNSNNSN